MKLSLGKLSLITGLVLAASSQASFASTLSSVNRGLSDVNSVTHPMDSAYNRVSHGFDSFANIFKDQRTTRRKNIFSGFDDVNQSIDHANRSINHNLNTPQVQEGTAIGVNADALFKARTSTQHSTSLGDDIKLKEYRMHEGPTDNQMINLTTT